MCCPKKQKKQPNPIPQLHSESLVTRAIQQMSFTSLGGGPPASAITCLEPMLKSVPAPDPKSESPDRLSAAKKSSHPIKRTNYAKCEYAPTASGVGTYHGHFRHCITAKGQFLDHKKADVASSSLKSAWYGLILTLTSPCL